jgi:hypothetical protein
MECHIFLESVDHGDHFGTSFVRLDSCLVTWDDKYWQKCNYFAYVTLGKRMAFTGKLLLKSYLLMDRLIKWIMGIILVPILARVSKFKTCR